jgi:hypothetical protein
MAKRKKNQPTATKAPAQVPAKARATTPAPVVDLDKAIEPAVQAAEQALAAARDRAKAVADEVKAAAKALRQASRTFQGGNPE